MCLLRIVGIIILLVVGYAIYMGSFALYPHVFLAFGGLCLSLVPNL
jgi:hypothetical protein